MPQVVTFHNKDAKRSGQPRSQSQPVVFKGSLFGAPPDSPLRSSTNGSPRGTLFEFEGFGFSKPNRQSPPSCFQVTAKISWFKQILNYKQSRNSPPSLPLAIFFWSNHCFTFATHLSANPHRQSFSPTPPPLRTFRSSWSYSPSSRPSARRPGTSIWSTASAAKGPGPRPPEI